MEPVNFQEIMMAGLGLVVGILGWALRREVARHDSDSRRIDTLEREMRVMVSREEHEQAYASLRVEMKEGQRETQARLDRILDLLWQQRNTGQAS